MKTRSQRYLASRTLMIVVIICIVLLTGIFIAGLVFLYHPDTRNVWERGYIPPATFMALDDAEKAVIYGQTYNNAVLMANLTKTFFRTTIDLFGFLALTNVGTLLLLWRYRRDCPSDKWQ